MLQIIVLSLFAVVGMTLRQLPGFAFRSATDYRDAMDGLIPNNLLQFEPQGFSVIPPDPGFQNQRVFVPKAALSSIQVMGVIGSPLRRSRKTKPADAKEQMEMFDKG